MAALAGSGAIGTLSIGYAAIGASSGSINAATAQGQSSTGTARAIRVADAAGPGHYTPRIRTQERPKTDTAARPDSSNATRPASNNTTRPVSGNMARH